MEIIYFIMTKVLSVYYVLSTTDTPLGITWSQLFLGLILFSTFVSFLTVFMNIRTVLDAFSNPKGTSKDNPKKKQVIR